jgi:hypothetical protein
VNNLTPITNRKGNKSCQNHNTVKRKQITEKDPQIQNCENQNDKKSKPNPKNKTF